MNYEEIVAYIERLPEITSKNKLSNTEELLKRLGNPEQDFKVIHVAGTNGKGSVCAFTAQILREAGYHTGLFTSPHLVKINERFQIDGQIVSDRDFCLAFQQTQEAVEAMIQDGFARPAYFEMLFAMGMWLFSRAQVDYLVMETGMGGARDATNAVAHPAAVAITSISLDHTEYLGNTLEEIAGEKAGIIKKGVPVIYDARERISREVIEKRARQMEAPMIPYYGEMCEITERTDKSIDFVFNNRYYEYKLVHVPYLADYQVVNSAMAMLLIRAVDPQRLISDETVLRGIADTRWSGRMETVLPGVVFDGAHNADGIRQFLKTVCQVQKERPVSLLFSSVMEKDYDTMIREICREASFSSIVVTQVEGSRKVDASRLAETFAGYTQATVLAEPDRQRALKAALSLRKPDGILFCVGSLYLIGELKELIAACGQPQGDL